jgi:hypothetical protein
MFQINNKYIAATLGLLLTEIIIALYLHDSFIRPFFGDFLASIFVYCAIKSVSDMSNGKAATISISVSYIIEWLQFVHFLEKSGLDKYHWLSILLGNSFAWADILAYSLGIAFVLFFEKISPIFYVKN